MAARHIARLRAQQDAVLRGSPDPEEESGSESSPVGRKKPPFNPFDFLNEDERPQPVASDDSDSDTRAEEQRKSSTAPQPQAQGVSKSKKTKKKKGKGKAKLSAEKETPELAKDQSEDIDKLLEEMKIVPGPSPSKVDSSDQKNGGADGEPLLAIDPKRLRPADEMRRVFGSRVTDIPADNAGEGGGRRVEVMRRRMQRMAGRGPAHRHGAPFKQRLLGNPKEHWPRIGVLGGLSMSCIGPSPHGLEFVYTHSEAYQGVQAVFEECQGTFDPHNILALLRQHPYHIDALLTMFDLYRATNQHEFAEEVLQMCLYALEAAWHPSFNPTARQCYLPFKHPENRPFYTALTRHMQSLSRRGLHGTALEVAKLTLSLDPEDPVGLLTSIDYYALRAQQYNFVVRLTEERGNEVAFPNMAYSRALASFEGSQARDPSGEALLDQEREVDSSQAMLTDAVLLYPLVVTRLMTKLKEQGVGKDAEWQSLLAKPLLRDATDGDNGSLDFLIKNYVERVHPLWKGQEVQAWLKRACWRAVEGKADISAQDWAALREEIFPPGKPNEYQHLRVFMDTSDGLPMEEVQAMLRAPPPPPQAGAAVDDNFAQALNVLENVVQIRAEGLVVNEADLREMGPLRAFLQTLLPWIDVVAGQPLPEGPHEAQAVNNAFEDEELEAILMAAAQEESYEEADPPPPPPPDVD
eukprot:jgi/Botrbrau1/14628/Bobra.0364s0012.1